MGKVDDCMPVSVEWLRSVGFSGPVYPMLNGYWWVEFPSQADGVKGMHNASRHLPEIKTRGDVRRLLGKQLSEGRQE